MKNIIKENKNIIQSIIINFTGKYNEDLEQEVYIKTWKNIKSYQEQGDSLGGIIKIVIKNVPAGLGSFVHFDRRIDSKLAGALMSIPAVKSVEVGLGRQYATQSGFNSHDEIYYDEA